MLERLRTRDRAIALGVIATVVLFAALYTVLGVGMQMSAIRMTGMARELGNPMQMPSQPDWSGLQFFQFFLMWWIMMIAMMTPSAAPTLLLFAALKRASGTVSKYAASVWLFLLGYLVAWAGFCVFAVLLQWSLRQSEIFAPSMMTLKGGVVVGVLLVVVGIYQLTPLKRACLKQCQSPAQFLTVNHRPGFAGAFLMGGHHGSYCVGCCWALMLLLFAGGIMNLWWIIGLSAFVALEKTVGPRLALPETCGAALIAVGAFVAFSSL